MFHRVALVRTDVSEERIAPIIWVTKIGELVTAVVITNNRSTFAHILMTEAIRSSEMSVLTRVTRRNIPADSILPSLRREYLKSYIALTGWACNREVMCLL
jgi:hypothetical protein